MEPYYLTTPIYYVNSAPHVGHAYTTIAADAAARHARQRGFDTFFLTGTDEHGANIAKAAAAEGMDPKAWADRVAERFKHLAHEVDATNDFFIRTTDPQHEAFVQRFVTTLRDNGDLYDGVYRGLYCSSCEAFYRESDLVDGLCPIHHRPVQEVEEQNTFFRLSAYADRLLAHYEAHPDFVLPRERMNEARSFVEGGLDDVSLSRQSTDWGVPLPWATDQVIYVWIDALLNYASALAYAGESDLTARYWPPRWQLLAKDILRFHAVIWPAMLLAAGYELPRQLYIHGYLMGHDGHKMSKTRGNGLDPQPAIEAYGVDALRYYLLREVAFGKDGSIGYQGLHDRYHSELANELGNLVSRTTSMIARYRGGTVPASVDPALAAAGRAAAESYASHMDELDFTGALEAAWVHVRALNRYVEEQAPWKQAKEEGDEAAARLDVTLGTLADGVRLIAVLVANVLPTTSGLILEAVGEPAGALGWDRARPGLLAAHEGVQPARPLFPRIETPLVA